MQEIHIYVSGIVQGVGFRSVVARHAQMYDIKGYVQNLGDGRVEICAQGKGDQIDHFIRMIQQKPGLAKIENIETKLKAAQETFSSFEMRH